MVGLDRADAGEDAPAVAAQLVLGRGLLVELEVVAGDVRQCLRRRAERASATRAALLFERPADHADRDDQPEDRREAEEDPRHHPGRGAAVHHSGDHEPAVTVGPDTEEHGVAAPPVRRPLPRSRSRARPWSAPSSIELHLWLEPRSAAGTRGGASPSSRRNGAVDGADLARRGRAVGVREVAVEEAARPRAWRPTPPGAGRPEDPARRASARSRPCSGSCARRGRPSPVRTRPRAGRHLGAPSTTITTAATTASRTARRVAGPPGSFGERDTCRMICTTVQSVCTTVQVGYASGQIGANKRFSASRSACDCATVLARSDFSFRSRSLVVQQN